MTIRREGISRKKNSRSTYKKKEKKTPIRRLDRDQIKDDEDEDDELKKFKAIAYSMAQKKKRTIKDKEVDEALGSDHGIETKNLRKPFTFDPRDPRVIRAFRQVNAIATLDDQIVNPQRKAKDAKGFAGGIENIEGNNLAEKYRKFYQSDIYKGEDGDITLEDYDKATYFVSKHREQLMEYYENNPHIAYDPAFDMTLAKRGVKEEDKEEWGYEPKKHFPNRSKKELTIKGDVNNPKTNELHIFVDDKGRFQVKTSSKTAFAPFGKWSELSDRMKRKYDFGFAGYEDEHGNRVSNYRQGDAVNVFKDKKQLLEFLKKYHEDPSAFPELEYVTIDDDVQENLGIEVDEEFHLVLNEDGDLVVDEDMMEKNTIKKKRIIERSTPTSLGKWDIFIKSSGERINGEKTFKTHMNGGAFKVRDMLEDMGIKPRMNGRGLNQTATLTESEMKALVNYMNENDWKDTKGYDTELFMPSSVLDDLGINEDGTFENEDEIDTIVKDLKEDNRNQFVREGAKPDEFRSVHMKLGKRENKLTGEMEDVVIVNPEFGKKDTFQLEELVERQKNYEGAMYLTKSGKKSKRGGDDIVLSLDEARKYIVDSKHNVDSYKLRHQPFSRKSAFITGFVMDDDTKEALGVDDEGNLNGTPQDVYQEKMSVKPEKKDEIYLVHTDGNHFDIRASDDYIEEKVKNLIFDTYDFKQKIWKGGTPTVKTFSLLNYKTQGGNVTYQIGDGKIPEIVEKLEESVGFDVKVIDDREGAVVEDSVDMKEEFTPRDYQQIAVEEIMRDGKGIMVIGTGGGKTFSASKMVGEFGKGNDIVVMAHNSYLLNQLEEEFEKFLGIDVRNVEEGLYTEDQDEDTPHDERDLNVNVFSIQSAVSAQGMDDAGGKIPKGKKARKKNMEIKKALENADVVLIDETHHLKGGNTFTKLVKSVETPNKVGLTATPSRTDEPEVMELHNTVGREVVNMDASYLIDRDFLVPPDIYWVKAPKSPIADQQHDTYHSGRNGYRKIDILEEDGSYRKGKNWMDAYNEIVRNQIVRNTERDRKIADIAKELEDAGNTTVVFVQEIEHGNNLKQEIGKKLGRDVPFLNGQVLGEAFVKDQMDKVREDKPPNWEKKIKDLESLRAKIEYMNTNGKDSVSFSDKDVKLRNQLMADQLGSGDQNVVIATNSIFGEGVDVPKIDAIINAHDDKSSISTLQKVGRAMRPVKGKKRAIVIDFEDEPVEGRKTGHAHDKRRAIYRMNPAFVQHDTVEDVEEITRNDDLKSTTPPNSFAMSKGIGSPSRKKRKSKSSLITTDT